MKKINYLLTVGVIASFLVPALAGATTVIPVQYELRDSSSDSVDVKIESSAVIADVDMDGSPDLQVVGGKAELEKFNSQSGGAAPATINTSHSNIKNMQAADLNRDGAVDVVVSEASRQTPKRDFGDRVVVRGWDSEKKEVVVEMEKNVKAIAEKDENIASLEIAPHKIEMKYRRPAKLFGFIPVAYQHAFSVDEKGNVAQGHPWWLMFAKDDADNFGSDVKYIFQNNQSDLVFVKMQTAIQQQMQRFSALSNVMKTRHDTAMNSIRNIK